MGVCLVSGLARILADRASPEASYEAAWNGALDRLDPASYPKLTALRTGLVTRASAEQFEYGLARLVSSLRLHSARSGRRSGRGR
jgi:hypothetical protein